MIAFNGSPIGHVALWFHDGEKRVGDLNLVIGDSEALAEKVGLSVVTGSISYFFQEYPNLENVIARRYKGISGEKYLPSLGFVKQDLPSHDFDVYSLKRERWQQGQHNVP